MQWEMIVALIIAVPVILFPAAYVWYMNIGGIYSLYMKAKARRRARKIKKSSGKYAAAALAKQER